MSAVRESLDMILFTKIDKLDPAKDLFFKTFLLENIFSISADRDFSASLFQKKTNIMTKDTRE